VSEALFITPNDNEELFFGRIKTTGKMCISIEIGKDEDSETNEFLINKEQAIQIISHLKEQFSI